MRIKQSILEDICYDADIDHEDIRWNYSGRFMYGDTCFGIIGDVPTLMRFAIACTGPGEDTDDGSWDWLTDVHSDDMGLSTIWYWPRVQVADEEEELVGV